MYQNTSYGPTKWFYAFVTGMKYINDNMTQIFIVEDVYMTWHFQCFCYPSYIERDMLSAADDVPGANLVPENLETGEYKIGATTDVSGLSPYYVWAYSGDTIKWSDSSSIPVTDLTNVSGHLYVNGLHTALSYIVATSNLGYGTVRTALKVDNQSEYVVAHFSVPSLAFDNTNLTAIGPLGDVYCAAGKAAEKSVTLSSRPGTIDGYTPLCKKVLQYPYLYIGFNPPQGTSKIYRYEDFTNGTPSFKLMSEVNPNPTVYIIPQNYRGKTGSNINDAASLNGYPQVASRVDVYNSWLAENSGIINVQQRQAATNYELDTYSASIPLFSGIVGMTGSGQGGDSVGSTVQGQLNSFTSTIDSAINITKLSTNYAYYVQMLNAQKEKQAMLPDNVTMGGSNATLLGYDHLDDAIFTQYNIKAQFARKIDMYFYVYGYQMNEFRLPNTHNRKYWNYVKTVGADIRPIPNETVPHEALQTLKLMYDSGITFWHDPAHFMDYGQNNNESLT